MIKNQKPTYWVTVRDALFDFLVAESGAARLYEATVYRAPVIKSIGLNPTVAESDIYASGITYDHIRRVQGAEISLGAVALEHALIDKAMGAAGSGGFVFDKTDNNSREFAFGYYIEQKDGNYVYYWHPRCILTQTDEAVETATDSAPDPNRSFTIKALPTSEGVWRVRYYTQDVGENALTPEQFFAFVRYTEAVQASGVTLGTAQVSTACTATVTYADNATPSNPTISYAWYLGSTEDGDFTKISGAESASYNPVAGDAGKYLKCVALISGSAMGYVESDAKKVSAAA